MRAVTYPSWSETRGCGPCLGPRAWMSSWRLGWQLTCSSICFPPPSPSKSWASQMASPGACCFHLSGAADPLRSLHPWEARFLSSLVPFQILIEVCGRWHLGECPGYDPCHLLEPVLCSNSPTGS